MKNVKVEVIQNKLSSYPDGRMDIDRVDAATDQDIENQIVQDDSEAMREMGAYVRRVRTRVGMTQMDFSRRIGISVEMLRNWEQGREYPTGTARALFRVIDKAPEVAVSALQR